MKRTIPLLITALAGFVLVVAYFVPFLENLSELATVHFDILAAVAFILGGGNLCYQHTARIAKGQRGAGYSAIALVAFFATLGVGMFKVGVSPKAGVITDLAAAGGSTAVGEAQLTQQDERRTLSIHLFGAPAEETFEVRLGGEKLGALTTDKKGAGSFGMVFEPPKQGYADESTKGWKLTQIESGQKLEIGDIAVGAFGPYARITGEFNEDGSALSMIYNYAFMPLQATMFALLAFYVASAAFRAFRARNVESVLLLGTAFIILLGRTYFGALLTGWLPDEGFWSFFDVTNLTNWIMKYPNNAGRRAIMIGIALGIASTSLKVLLGIDRSYLGGKG